MIPELDASQLQIQRVISSKAFKTSEVHRNLLTYLSEKSLSGDAQNLKEYTVGLDVFGKPPSYDPRQESVVRMHVGRLRQKLAEYYRTEGLTDPDLASQLVARLKRQGGVMPRYYQVVLKIKAMDETPVDISYVAHRELTISKRPLAARGNGK